MIEMRLMTWYVVFVYENVTGNVIRCVWHDWTETDDVICGCLHDSNETGGVICAGRHDRTETDNVKCGC